MGAHGGSFLSDMKCWVLLLLVCASYVLAQNNCSYTDGSGNTFDLSPLTYDPSQSSPDGYNAQDTAGQTYYINFCQEVSQVSLSACSKTSPSAVCQTSSGNYHPAGSVSTQQFSSAWNDANAPAHEGNFTSGIVVNPGWVIIFIVCIFFFVYVAVGMAIKFVKFEARGLDIVPNYDFWKDVPALFKEGCIFFIQKVSCGKLCAGYTEI